MNNITPTISMRRHALIYLNGVRLEVPAEEATQMLADYLREVKNLTGTKIVCAEGDCGACSVLRINPSTSGFEVINSCITTVAQLDGSSLVTVDALASTRGSDALTEIQSKMVQANASQCGFCTPGFVVALTGWMESRLCGDPPCGKNRPTHTIANDQEIKNALTGNLCRCTGYQPIIMAAKASAREATEALSPSDGTLPNSSGETSSYQSLRSHFYTNQQQQDLTLSCASPLLLECGDLAFFAPTRLSDAIERLRDHPETTLIAGGTDLGVLHNKRKSRLHSLMSLHLIPELSLLETLQNCRVRVGARVTLTELRQGLKALSPEIARFIDVFASPQIKNVATLVGNVANASPIGDTPPLLLVLNASVELRSHRGSRSVPLTDFFEGYRRTIRQKDELITSIEFDLPKITETEEEILKLYKVSQRKDLDISTVNAAFRIRQTNKDPQTLADFRFAMGGVAATPLRLKSTEDFINTQLSRASLTGQDIEASIKICQSELTPLSDLRGSAAFRRVIIENLIGKFWRELGVL